MDELLIDNEVAYKYKYNDAYYLTKNGDVYSTFVIGGQGKTDISKIHKLKYGVDKDGYYRVVLSLNSEKRYVKVHTLIVEQFIGDITDGMEINHKDGNKKNNKVCNLEIVTPRENTVHAHESGLCRSDIPVVVEYDGELFHFASCAECERRFPDISRHYLSQIKNDIVTFSMIYFKKKHPEKRISEIEAYYNGSLYATYNTMLDAEKAFGKKHGAVSSAIKSSVRGKTINQYKIYFPNVSTIENMA